VDTPTNSGKGQRIWRCAGCQVALWSNYAGAGDLIRFVRVGTLDEPDRWPRASLDRRAALRSQPAPG
jgi:hypothetical protein